MPIILITGAGRGLGLEFAKQYASEGWHVVGTVRRATGADALVALGGSVEVVEIDVDDLDAVRNLPTTLGNRRLDVAIFNAGINADFRASPTRFDAEEWQRLFHTNVIAQTALAGALYPLVREGHPGKLLAMSSALGSLALNSDEGMSAFQISMKGGQYLYRSSKAALNMVWRSFAIDHPDVVACLLSPGWVRTDMGGAGAHLSPEESVAGMKAAIASMTLADSGSIVHYDGRKIPW